MISEFLWELTPLHPLTLMNFSTLNKLLQRSGETLSDPLLLGIRLYWGIHFFQTGWGKLSHLERTTGYFASLGLPFPMANVLAAGSTEMFGGLLLAVGLWSRLASLPLAFTMGVAYVTAEREALAAFWSDSDKFTSAAPFLFLYAVLIVFSFGPGKISLDYLLETRKQRSANP